MDYIVKSTSAGYNVLSDKPMVINKEGFELLKTILDSVRTHDLYLYDLMTERYDIHNILTHELMNSKELFDDLQEGTTEEPAISMQSVHHYFKEESGKVLVRPTWFYDVEQQGEDIVDVAIHMVDLINWQCFSDELIDYRSDVKLTSANHWRTKLTLADFIQSTNLDAFPVNLKKYVTNDILEVFGNGSINYQVNGKNIAVTVL